MTNQGPRKTVNDDHSAAWLLQAREFHESARNLVTLAQSKSYNGAITLMVTAAIAYADAVTAEVKGVVNKQDHQNAPRLLREVLGNRLPDKQENFYRRLLGRKDEVNYGARSTTLGEAERLMAELDEFAAWAEGVLRPMPKMKPEALAYRSRFTCEAQ
ncbi:MAG TPA: hypothetical protein VLA16_22285 [Ideonella sp.]|nr:hypothetical protein [Ideonella sp.]